MIQIKRPNLDRYAQEHYDSLHTLVQKNIDNFRKKLNANKNINPAINATEYQQIEELLKSFSDNIVILLKGHLDSVPKDLEKEFKKLEKLSIKLKDNKKNDISQNFPYWVLTIFNYDNFSNKDKNDYNAYDLAQKLKVDTCPYCNRSYTSTLIYEDVDEEGKVVKKRRVRPDWDHFIPKAKYPYLALNFYNLIPSCKVCNSGLKLAIPFGFDTHLHPYTEGFGNQVRFKLKVKDVNFFNGKMTPEEYDDLTAADYSKYKEAQIIIDTENAGNLKTKAENNIKVFELGKLYQEHLDYVYEIVNKAMIYNDDYLNSLSKQFNIPFKNRSDVLRFITANYTDEGDLHLRPLSKLTKDIVEQFDL